MNPGLKRLNNVLVHSYISDEAWIVDQIDIDSESSNEENHFKISGYNPTLCTGLLNRLSIRKDRLNRRDWNEHYRRYIITDD